MRARVIQFMRRLTARCERACESGDEDAQELLRRGDPLAALRLLDEVDARCRCARFTSGDAPPQYALAIACLQRLRDEGRDAERRQALVEARGPILRDLAVTERD